MTSVLSHNVFHPSIGHAFGELFVLDQISQLPPDSILRILKTIPEPLLRDALSGGGALVLLEAENERQSRSG